MHAAHVVVTLLAVVANVWAAVADLVRAKFVLANSASVGVPESWLVPLGLVKAAGAAGLVLGLLGVPLVGTAAAAGLVLFFVGAVLVHVRARNYAVGAPVTFLALAAAAFGLGLA
ncbi:DoxX-like protein [Pseudonocardia hierapolitana]|uniref:DoxX-like protein n=1 Tax=Pseudonocardia hierapolitana TaxID=1128676 RepID=A0A561SL09_9PSEU|nr:DoxX family protein [Pseudonocardia hierapolitana]TWF75547.1 DoxX-like protein [Pseudonocardia hierapolitana]